MHMTQRCPRRADRDWPEEFSISLANTPVTYMSKRISSGKESSDAIVELLVDSVYSVVVPAGAVCPLTACIKLARLACTSFHIHIIVSTSARRSERSGRSECTG